MSELTGATKAALEASSRSAFVVTADELIQMELPERRLLLAPWLPAQGLVMVYAPRGVGKTYFALNVAYAVAAGGGFLGWVAPDARKVLYLDGEMPANVMQQRIADIRAAAGKVAIPDHFRVITPDLQGDHGMPDLSTSVGQAALEQALEGIDLVVVDNISTLCRRGVENEAESWFPVQEWALRLRARGTSVLFVHHAGKGGTQRGTSKREDILDTVINLKRPADYSPEQGAAFEVHFEKNRSFMGEDAEALDVTLKQQQGRMIWDFRKVEASNYRKVVELAKEGVKQADIARELDLNPSTVSRHLRKAKGKRELP